MILFVCEGNVCRSPLAAGLLREALPGDIPITSAGIRITEGEGVDEDTRVLAQRFGVDLTGHRSRQVTAEILAESCLILTATRRVRRAVVELYPPAVQHAFTIRQIGRILADSTSDSLPDRTPDQVTALCTFALRQRGAGRAGAPRSDDVVDPYGRTLKVHETAARQMLPALNVLAAMLGGERISVPERGRLVRLGLHSEDAHR